jgi:putative ABC transport system permease protein
MRELLSHVCANLLSQKLRSGLSMFGTMWGVASVVLLSAIGEGFQRGNRNVLEELGKNITIVWGGRTSLHASGDRRGRRIVLTGDDARALARESRLIATVSPEIERFDVTVASAYNAAAFAISGIEPQYQSIRTIDIAAGRPLRALDDERRLRVAILGATTAKRLFGSRDALGQTIRLNGIPYNVVGTIRRKDQDSSYSGPDNDRLFVPFSSMHRDFPLIGVPAGAVSQIIVAPRAEVVATLPRLFAARTGRIEDIDWPVAKELRRILGSRHRFDSADRAAIVTWDTTLQTLMFDRVIRSIRDFFIFVGVITLSLGGLGVMNVMLVVVRERTHEIGVRKAVGATSFEIQRLFFLEGFLLTMLSGALGFLIAIAVSAAVNRLPMPAQFQGMALTWQAGTATIAALTCVAALAATYPARRAARLPPAEALRFEDC